MCLASDRVWRLCRQKVDISEEEIPLEFWLASSPVFLCTLKVKDQNFRVKKKTKKSAPENELHQFITQSKIQTFPSSNGEENYVSRKAFSNQKWAVRFQTKDLHLFSVPAFMTSSSQIAQLKWPKVLSSLSEHLPRKSFLDVKSLWLLGFAFLWRYESDLQRKYFLICWPFFPRLEASATTLLPISNLIFTACYVEELASRVTCILALYFWHFSTYATTTRTNWKQIQQYQLAVVENEGELEKSLLSTW